MSQTAVIDPATATTLRTALGVAQSGRLSDAVSIAEQAIGDSKDPAPLHALAGMLRCQSGDLAGGAEQLRAALKRRPADPAIAFNLATALYQQGLAGEALEVATADRAQADPTLRLARLRGFLAQDAGDYSTAIESYRHVLAAQPNDWETWNNLGNALTGLGEHQEAASALERAAALNPRSAPIRLNLGQALFAAGRLEEAVQRLEAAATDFPSDAKPLRELHILYQKAGREEQALSAIRRAAEREPDDFQLQVDLAQSLGSNIFIDEAEQLFRKLVARQPAHSEANIGLAICLEYSNKAQELRELAESAERNRLAEGALNLIKAFSFRRQKDFEKGLAALRHVPADLEPIRQAQLYGQFHDALGQADDAFAAFTRMNQLHAASPSEPLVRAEEARRRLQAELSATTAEWTASWTPPPSPDGPSPVFLVGFPRSGTTLLDTLLMGHPDVEVMEERPALNIVEAELGGHQALAALTQERIKFARDRYWAEVARHVSVSPGTTLVDKSPLFLNKVPLIQRIFPDAKFILALRHPCDVLLSCYVSNFRLNASMSNFLRLEDAAAFYDLSFSAWERGRELFELDVTTVVYEEMVEDAGAALRPVLENIGLSWHDEVLDHQATAAKRGLITTASYSQVTEPIYKRSSGRWTGYRKHLEPVLPILRPWIDRFGYSL